MCDDDTQLRRDSLTAVFSFLNGPKDIAAVCRVCKTWRDVARESGIVAVIVPMRPPKPVQSEDLLKWLRQFRALERIACSSVWFAPCPCAFLEALIAEFPNLTHISLSGDAMSTIPRQCNHDTFGTGGGGAKLEFLKLADSSLHPKFLEALCAAAPKLRVLLLSDTTSPCKSDPVPQTTALWPSLEFLDAEKFGVGIPNGNVLVESYWNSAAPAAHVKLLHSSSAILFAEEWIERLQHYSRNPQFSDAFSVANALLRIEHTASNFQSAKNRIESVVELFGRPQRGDDVIRVDPFSVVLPHVSPAMNPFGEKYGSIYSFQRFIDSGYPVDLRWPGEPTLLAECLPGKRFHWSLRDILHRGANPNLARPDVLLADGLKDAELVALVNAGANVNIVDESGRTPLHRACRACQPNVIAALLQHGAKVTAVDSSGRTPLVSLCQSSHSEMPAADLSVSLQLLIDGGASLDEVDPESGRNCFLSALWASRKERVKEKAVVFVDHGVRFADCPRLRRTVMKEVTKQRQFCPALVKGILRLLSPDRAAGTLAALDGEAMIHICQQCDDTDLVKVLLDASPGLLDVRGAEGQTPLMAAIAGNRNNVAKLLLERGACPVATDENSVTPLMISIASDNSDVLACILDRGARETVNVPDSEGVFPLMVACESGSATVVSTLLAAGADPNASSPKADPAIFHCSNPEVVTALISRGADIRKCDSTRRTILHWAAEKGTTEICRLCCEQAPDLVHVKDTAGNRPIDLAKTRAIRGMLTAQENAEKKRSLPVEDTSKAKAAKRKRR